MSQSIFDPGHLAFGGGPSATNVTPTVLALLVLLGILILVLPRRFVIAPLLFGLLMIPYAQNFYIGGVHLFVAKILILIGVSRLLLLKLFSSSPLLSGGFGTVDKFFLVWAIYRALAGVLLFGQVGAIPGQLGFLWDALGGYFLFRCLVRDDDDISRVIRTVAIIAVVVATGMVYEHMTVRNMFAFMGSMPAPALRDGNIRAQAIFGQPILAGTFGATIFPLFVWLWKYGQARILALSGMIASIVISYTASTSTALMALAGGIGALFLWPMRKQLHLLRWAGVAAFIGLAIVMKAPVWYVMAHIDLAGGSTGSHRAELITKFIQNFWDWWLIGTHNNVNWGWDMWDEANQFVLEGLTGGIVGFSCFIAMFTICYRRIGLARAAVESDRKKEWLFWIFGAVLFDQTLAFFGIDYFDQMRFMWYLMLAMILATTAGVLARVEDKVATPAKAVVSGGVPLFEPASPKPQFTARTLARR